MITPPPPDGGIPVPAGVPADQALRTSESRYRRLFETAQDGILLLNADTAQIEDVNPYLITMLGYSHAEFLGKKLWEVGPFADRAESKEMFVQLQKHGYVRYEDLPLRTKAGADIEVEFVSNSYDCAGIKVIQCNIRNITDRKAIEKKLRAAEEQFRGLVEQTIAGIYIIQDGNLAYLNPHGAQIIDQGTLTELIGTDPMSWIVEADRSKVLENLRLLTSGEASSLPFDFGVVRRDGTLIRIGANGSRATHEGRPAVIGMLRDVSEIRHAEEEIQRYIVQLRAAFMSIIEVATVVSELRDPYTAGHEKRVAEIAVAIGAELGFDERRQEGLRVAGYLHDIGKMALPSEILSKPGKLNANEYRLIQGHARLSYDVLKDVKWPWPAAQVALQHHERMDGSGYPQGLRGEAIVLEARIMAVADVIEAMSSHRPYRAALGIEAALAEIERGRGTLYDAEVTDACLRLFREKHFPLPRGSHDVQDT